MSGVTVIKRNISGEETWRYNGQILRKNDNVLILEALFNLDDTPFMGTFLKRGDRFVEIYYSDRWYNIFEVHDRDDDSIKGWYCNIARPVVFEIGNCLSFVDLALDLWIAPDGTQTVLDEDEFENLNLDGETQEKALSALEQLKTMFSSSSPSSIFL